MAKKHVFFYGAGRAEAKGADLSKNVLGGKGIGLMEMTIDRYLGAGGFYAQHSNL